jgi:hypothetical protein
MFIIIYTKIVDGKKQGLKMEGPFQGPEIETMKEAHEECTKIVNSSKDIVLVKILDLEKFTYTTAIEKAAEDFKYSFGNMEEASKILERPIKKRKKKRYNVKPSSDTA